MKELIIKALNDAFAEFKNRIPQTRTDVKYVDIENVSPLEIVRFMVDNNIPMDAEFGGRPNGYDAFEAVCLCYNVKIPTTEKEKLNYCKANFASCAFRHVYNMLTSVGYKRVGFSTRLLNEFDDTTVYEMYINNEFDRLVKYYSLPFVTS